jgi:hypothetical protein
MWWCSSTSSSRWQPIGTARFNAEASHRDRERSYPNILKNAAVFSFLADVAAGKLEGAEFHFEFHLAGKIGKRTQADEARRQVVFGARRWIRRNWTMAEEIGECQKGLF